MANFLQITLAPGFEDFAFYNMTGTDIPANSAVIVDVLNVLGVSNIVDGVAVKLPTAGNQFAIGFTQEILKANGAQAGRVRCGGLAKGVATGVIAAGATVAADFAGTPGNIITGTAGNPQMGMALSASTATGDEVLVLLALAKNA